MNTTEGWQVDPRPAPPELSPDFVAEPYDAALPFENNHIAGWGSFGELLGPEGVKALERSVL